MLQFRQELLGCPPIPMEDLLCLNGSSVCVVNYERCRLPSLGWIVRIKRGQQPRGGDPLIQRGVGVVGDAANFFLGRVLKDVDPLDDRQPRTWTAVRVAGLVRLELSRWTAADARQVAATVVVGNLICRWNRCSGHGNTSLH